MKFCKIFLVLIFFISGLLFPFIASAQNISPSLSVSPHTFDLGVLPGEVQTGKIKIGNRSEVALPILARTVDFSAVGEEGEMTFDELSQDISFASRKWIKIENPSFILNPGETKEVYFTIQVPENAEPGGHYAVMLFEPQLPSFYFEEGQPRAIPIIGVLFLFSVKTFALEPEVQQKLDIVEFSLPKEEKMAALENFLSSLIGGVARATVIDINIVEKSPSKFVLRIKNNDIYHHKPQGKLLIYNTFGKKVGESEIQKATILPGKIRRFPVEFSSEIPEKLKWLPASISNFLVQNTSFGKYKAVMALEIPGQKLETETQFWALPWKIFLPLLFLIITLILTRRRIVAAIKVLLGIKRPVE